MNDFSSIKLLQYCAAAVFVLNREHQVLHWNEACERLTGIKSQHIVGTRNQWQAFYDNPRPCLSDISKHSGAQFSHGICPDCMRVLYPDFLYDQKGAGEISGISCS